MSHMEPNLAFCMGKAAYSFSRKAVSASSSGKLQQMPEQIP